MKQRGVIAAVYGTLALLVIVKGKSFGLVGMDRSLVLTGLGLLFTFFINWGLYEKEVSASKEVQKYRKIYYLLNALMISVPFLLGIFVRQEVYGEKKGFLTILAIVVAVTLFFICKNIFRVKIPKDPTIGRWDQNWNVFIFVLIATMIYIGFLL